MAKFEFEFELQGLQGMKLKIKAERAEELPQQFEKFGRQLAGMMQSPAQTLEPTPERKQIEATVRDTAAGNADAGKGSGGKGKTNKRRSGNGDTEPAKALVWQHDPAKWGMPKQSWRVGKKLLWISYVIQKELARSENTPPVLAETFNTYFKQFGPVNRKNTPRDLGTLKTAVPALMLENATASPVTWYLTEEGNKEAEKLVVEAKSNPANGGASGGAT